MKGLRYALYIALYLVLLTMSGLLNIVIFHELDWSLLLDDTFWIGVIADYTLYIGFFVVTVLFVYENYGDKDFEYTDLENLIFSKANMLSTDEFRGDNVNYNFKEKKEVWLQTIKVAHGNYERKKTHKMHVEITTLPKEKWSKKTLKLQTKIDELKEYLSNEFISENLYYRKNFDFNLKTKFKKIDYEEITVEEIIYGSITLPKKKSRLVRRPLLRRITHKVIMLIPSLAFKIVYEILTIDKFVSKAETIKALSYMLAMIFVYVVAGIFSGKKAHVDRKINTTVRYGFVLDFENGHRYPKAPIYEVKKAKEVELIAL